jgi:hypothetical protein
MFRQKISQITKKVKTQKSTFPSIYKVFHRFEDENAVNLRLYGRFFCEKNFCSICRKLNFSQPLEISQKCGYSNAKEQRYV